MKFGRLVYRYTGKTIIDDTAIYNIGDNIQTFAMDNVYEQMGIKKEDIININLTEMRDYEGDYVIVPMAGYASHYKRCAQLPPSPKIIPLFVSFEMSDETCDDIVPYLKEHMPIGCRDEATMRLLRRKGVEAYVSGCITITLPKRDKEPDAKKTFFVDVSSKLEQYIPKELKENCEYVTQEGTIGRAPMTEEDRLRIDSLAKETLEKYKKEASLVVTSRLHAASPCLALGIPVICAIDNIDERFSWLDKLIPIYDVEHYHEIDWEPKSINIEELKKSITQVVIKRLKELLEKKSDIYDLSSFWEKRKRVVYNARLMHKLEFLKQKYDKAYELRYIIWGAGVHGKLAYSMIQEYYPNAKLIAIVDNYMDGNLFDTAIIRPQEVYKYEFDYALITTHPGRLEAAEILENMGKRYAEGYCYFISKDVPEEKYKLSKEDQIVLYACNEYAKQQVDRLTDAGYHVAGIIDKNADCTGGGYKTIPILQDITQILNRGNICVFIMLQNGMLHWEIARDLYNKGIDKVVFLPLQIGFYNRKIQTEMIIQYNYMIAGDYSLIENFRLCDEMFCENIAGLEYLRKPLRNGDVVVWVPSELLRTTIREPGKYADIPIREFTPYFNLFIYLGGEEIDIAEYVHLFGKAPYPSESKEAYMFVLKKRDKLYTFFEEKFNTGNIEYFVASAPKAVWNEKGYLNLCEGQHRCVYLLFKGLNKVPVRLKVDDYTELQKRMAC